MKFDELIGGELEKGLLGCVLLESKIYVEVFAKIGLKHFKDGKTRTVAKALSKLAFENPNFTWPDLWEYMWAHGERVSFKNLPLYLATLTDYFLDVDDVFDVTSDWKKYADRLVGIRAPEK